MEKRDLNRLMDLIEEAKKADEIISLHKSMGDADFMVDQYEAKKAKLVSDLIDELVSLKIQSLQSFSLIQRIIDRFYPAAAQNTINYDDEIGQLAAAI